MAYFTIMAELRGCYADNDSAFHIKADTRRELKEALEGEARHLRDAGAVGLSKRAIASHAAEAWRRRNADPLGQLDIGDSAVGLDLGENFEVDLV